MIEKGHIAVWARALVSVTVCARTHIEYLWLVRLFVLSIGHNHGTNQITTSISFRIRHFVLLTIFFFFVSLFCITFDEPKLKLQRQKSLTISSPLKPPLYFDCLNAIYVNCTIYWG